MASDFHTHFPQNGITALVSSPHLQEKGLTSLEIHPWNLPETFDRAILPDHEKIQSFDAIGEVGLDKLRGPNLAVQEQYFRAILDIAAEIGKPVVIHSVRAYPEILAILKHYKLQVMVHGFRSSPEMLDELWRHKITVSFHPAAAQSPELMNKLHNAAGRFGFESDNQRDINVRQLLSEVAQTYALSDLEKVTDQHFADFLEI